MKRKKTLLSHQRWLLWKRASFFAQYDVDQPLYIILMYVAVALAGKWTKTLENMNGKSKHSLFAYLWIKMAIEEWIRDYEVWVRFLKIEISFMHYYINQMTYYNLPTVPNTYKYKLWIFANLFCDDLSREKVYELKFSFGKWKEKDQ